MQIDQYPCNTNNCAPGLNFPQMQSQTRILNDGKQYVLDKETGKYDLKQVQDAPLKPTIDEQATNPLYVNQSFVNGFQPIVPTQHNRIKQEGVAAVYEKEGD